MRCSAVLNSIRRASIVGGYALAATPLGYAGPHAPLNDIRSGNNWFYAGHAGYDQGTGVGTLDVDNFARALLLLGY
jgi:hypothetical protein